jgi:hypothetical protein
LTDDTVRLRYTGDQATTFQAPGVGHLQPGDGFEVPPELVLSFMRRADVEHVGKCPSPPCRCGEEPVPRGPEDPEASEAASDSQDGETSGGRRSGGRSRSGSPKGKNEVSETAVP